MATQVQFRRGTTAQNASFTGALGEVTVDTDKDTLVVHDGGTAGGFEISRADASNLKFPDGAVGTPAISFASDTNTGIYRGGTDILKFVTAGTDAITIDASQDVTLAGSLNFADNEKAFFGAGSDLQIYHDPANGNRSVIKESGGGSLHILATNLIVENTTDSKTSAQFIDGGAVELYHNSVKKFETTSTGIDVTGTATMDGLTVDGSESISITSTNGNTLNLYRSGTGADSVAINFRDGSNDRTQIKSSDGGLSFHINGTTRAVDIDSSGNLLVGKTAPNVANVGFEAKSDGANFMTRDDGEPLKINRKTFDGNLIAFAKDGNARGAIGTSSNNLAIHGAGTGDEATGVMFVNSASTQRIVPCQEGFTINDGIINLGHSSNRFKNLYLSGGLVLDDNPTAVGGAVTSKTLDDYEEGTWTPSVDSGTNTVNEATYTKVGRLVTVSAVLSNFSDTTTASIITISGLPFTVSHQGFGICDGERFDVSLIVAQARTSDSKIALKNGVGSTDFTSVDYADINDGVDVALSFTVTYFAT